MTVATALTLAGLPIAIAACESDDGSTSVSSRSREKTVRTYDSPDQKTTVTTTHEKNTNVYPK